MKKYFKLLIAMIIYLVIVVINSNVYAATEGIVTKDTVRMREKASTESKIVTLVSENQKVEVLEKNGEWYKIKFKEDGNTYTGFVRTDMLKVNGDVVASSEDETVTEEKKDVEEEKTEETASVEEIKTEEAKTEEKKTEEIKTEENESTKQEAGIKEGTSLKIQNKINIKILPLISSSTVSEMEKDTEITVSEILGNWCYIESENQNGWTLLNKIVSNSTAEVTKTEEDKKDVEENKEEEKQEEEKKEEEKKEEEKKEKLSKIEYISVSTVNLREKADTSSKILEKLSMNTKVTVVEETADGWSKVEVSGKTGYISSKYLSTKKTEVSSRGEDETRTEIKEETKKEETKKEETKKEEAKKEEAKKNEEKEEAKDSSSSSASGSAVVSYARNYLGCKYVWGAAGPKTFDCSGFTMYVYKHFGYNLSHGSGAQASAGKGVKRSELKEGDLVCYSGHVAIYVGGGKIIHAYNSKAGVVITGMDELYNKIVGYRRIIN